MRVKEISVTYGRKVQVVQFEPAHIEITVFADLDDGENEAEAAELLRQMARNQVVAEVARLSPELAKKLNGKLDGLPMGINMSNYDEALNKKRQLLSERDQLDKRIESLEEAIHDFGESMRDESPHDFFSNYPDNN